MKKLFLSLVLILSAVTSSHAVYVKLPGKAILEHRFKGKNLDEFIQQIDAVNQLADNKGEVFSLFMKVEKLCYLYNSNAAIDEAVEMKTKKPVFFTILFQDNPLAVSEALGLIGELNT